MLRIKELRKTKKMSQQQIADVLGITQAAFSGWENGRYEIDNASLIKLADFFDTSTDYILGRTESHTESQPNVIFLDDKKIHLIPLYESVSAGFGATAYDEIVDYVPLYFTSEAEASQTICIRVRGDSMFPKIEDGDLVQVHKQTSVDSGDLAVILLDGTEGLVKKVIYGPDWVELHSVNPMYPIQRFEKEDVLRIRVLGLVKKIIKDA